MALFPPQYIDCVVAIGTNKSSIPNWIGTGFLYGDLLEKGENDINRYQVYLVTNKHVLLNLDSIILRVNPQNDDSAISFPIPLIKSDGKTIWVGNPDPSIDVAVTEINYQILVDHGMKSNFFKSDQAADIKELKNRGSSEGDGIFVLGFPMGMVSENRNYVFVRSGIISRINDLFENRSSDFIIDALIFPGNSGGPVISKPEIGGIQGTGFSTYSSLIGIVKSYISYEEVAVSQQTGKPRIVFQENTGLTLVEPVDHINSTIIEAKRIMSSI